MLCGHAVPPTPMLITSIASAEMVPFSHHVGELRAHYAGTRSRLLAAYAAYAECCHYALRDRHSRPVAMLTYTTWPVTMLVRDRHSRLLAADSQVKQQ